MAIELVEYIVNNGKIAETTGGKQKVIISIAPAYIVPAYWNNPSVNCRRHAWKVPERHVPTRYVVIRENGDSSSFATYDKAVEVALYHAARKPKEKTNA